MSIDPNCNNGCDHMSISVRSEAPKLGKKIILGFVTTLWERFGVEDKKDLGKQ